MQPDKTDFKTMNNIFLHIQLLQVIPGTNAGLLIALIPLLPLAGFVFLGLFGRKRFNQSAGIIATTLLTSSAGLAFYTA